MVADSGAGHLFVDGAAPAFDTAARRIYLDGAAQPALQDWLAAAGTRVRARSTVQPDWPFNIIYSSGTTGTPKGIVQPHGMRWAHVARAEAYGYGPDTVTLLATSLCSNTTLVCFFPTIARGGCVVLAPPKFDAATYLAIAEKERATHTMLVPVQYQRIMALPQFDRFDLSSFRMKFCTSAPFHAALKADILKRWPGGLVEFYGMTEGGGTCILEAHNHPDKLHTVGKPPEGHDIRLIDEDGRELPPGGIGEVVGRSPSMMTGYHNQPALSRAAEWHDGDGNRFLRTGDVGRFDEDGFLTLMDRRKDMVISGGFNIYPSDLEGVLRRHPGVADAAVVGVPSVEWGETPVAFVVPRARRAAGRGTAHLGQRASWARRSGWRTCATCANCRAARSARCSSASCATPIRRRARAEAVYLPSRSESPGVARSIVSLTRCQASRDACRARSQSRRDSPRASRQPADSSGSISS